MRDLVENDERYAIQHCSRGILRADDGGLLHGRRWGVAQRTHARPENLNGYDSNDADNGPADPVEKSG